MSGKCVNCNGKELYCKHEVVCTKCGTVSDPSPIVSDLAFQAICRASSHYVPPDSRGGARGFGSSTSRSAGISSRDATLRLARQSVSALGQQLRLSRHCVDTAYGFYRTCFGRGWTRGRRRPLVAGACVYVACRTERTAHLLSDVSDALDVDTYALGRTYLHLCNTLDVAIPTNDPCLNVLRYANRMDFGDKSVAVATTALRVVQRMKRDWLHCGRRVAGVCGAALLVAARLHDFGTTPEDVARVVRVHGLTLRKRLMEFGDTPAGGLTVHEFMTGDLAEEEDPPSFKAARSRDRERLRKELGAEPKAFDELRGNIEEMLETQAAKQVTMPMIQEFVSEISAAAVFCVELTDSTKDGSCAIESLDVMNGKVGKLEFVGKRAYPVSPGVEYSKPSVNDLQLPAVAGAFGDDGVVNFDDLNDDEMDCYVMRPSEVASKEALWNRVNADYVRARKEKEAALRREREAERPGKKRRRDRGKERDLSAAVADEDDGSLPKGKMSSKINYEVLKELNRRDKVKEQARSGQGCPTAVTERPMLAAN